METFSKIKIEKRAVDVKIESAHKISKSYVGTYKEMGEESFNTKFTIIKTTDEAGKISWEVILQDSFEPHIEDMICKNILDHAEDLDI